MAVRAVVELRPDLGRELSANEPTTGVAVLEAFPLLRVEVDMEGGRGRVAASSRFMFARELVRFSTSPLSSPLTALLVGREVPSLSWSV